MLELGELDSVIDHVSTLQQHKQQQHQQLESALLPFALEAAWRLQKWTSLDTFLKCLDGDLDSSGGRSSVSSSDHSAAFQVSLSRLFLSLQRGDQSDFAQQLQMARLRSMSLLSAATLESYGRAYPYLTQLHVLTEMETGFQLVHARALDSLQAATSPIFGVLLDGADSNDTNNTNNTNNANNANSARSNSSSRLRRTRSGSSSSSSSRNAMALPAVASNRLALTVHAWHWAERLQVTAPTLAVRTLITSVRRGMLSVAGLSAPVGRSWLSLARARRASGCLEAARAALRQAELCATPADDVLLEECHLLRASGQTQKALQLLEPVSPDILKIRLALKVPAQVRRAASFPSL
jgi:hypothetical protein